MCEVCEASIITEAILCLFLIVALAITPIVPQFVWVYFLIGFLVFLIEIKFEITRFFFGSYFPFEVGIFISLYPLIFVVDALSYYVGEEVAPPCPYCGEVAWGSISKRGKIYGECKNCKGVFVK